MHEFVVDKCELILESIIAIENYTQEINSAENFKETLPGQKSLDAVMMRLQSIGENVKKISKIDISFFNSQLRFDTNNIIRFRDFISHHYEKLDSEIVFEICRNDIPIQKLYQ